MATIVIASSRAGAVGPPREIWADLIMAVNSATLYAAEHDVLVAWQGPVEPGPFLDNPRLRMLTQPDSCRSYGEAYGFATRSAGADELILMNDDAVLVPDSIPLLLEDAALVRREHPGVRIGMLAARSNFVGGPQNIRVANDSPLRPNGNGFESEGRILPLARVSPILARIERAALEAIGGFPPINWFSDDLMCYDLMKSGYTNLVSRAYVHHIGQRATTRGGVTEKDLHRDGLAWVREHRPDFWRELEPTPA